VREEQPAEYIVLLPEWGAAAPRREDSLATEQPAAALLPCPALCPAKSLTKYGQL